MNVKLNARNKETKIGIVETGNDAIGIWDILKDLVRVRLYDGVVITGVNKEAATRILTKHLEKSKIVTAMDVINMKTHIEKGESK